MLAFLEVVKIAALSTLAALLFSPWLSDLHTVMLGVGLFYLNLVRITPGRSVKAPPGV